MKKEDYKIIIAILVTTLVVGCSVFIWTSMQKGKEMREGANMGIIEGALSYPSDYIPKELKVCAANVRTEKEYCTKNHIFDPKYNPNENTLGEGYKLEVPIGDYQVYAFLPDRTDWKAYYSNYVVCIDSGLYENCNSHDPIEISVLTNQITSNIDPGDWYAW